MNKIYSVVYLKLMRAKNFAPFIWAIGFLWLGFNYPVENSTKNDFEKILYTLSVDEKNYETFNVKIEVKDVDSEALILRMPLWSPGAYRLRDYPKNVKNFQAFDKFGKKLQVEKISKDGWRVQVSNHYAFIKYDVKPAYEFWSGNSLDSTYALIQGPSVFMYIEGKESTPILIKYLLPEGWNIASPLEKINDSNLFYAENYDVFIDAPAQLGYFHKYTFSLKDVPIDLVFYGDYNFSVDSFLVMVKDICVYQTKLFGEIPFNRYVFFYKLLPGFRSGGGLEHLNSTTIGLSSQRLVEDLTSAADVTAHEFFHVWNVKRIRPKGLGPFDYTKEARTKALWFSEGVTSYYATLTLVRANIWSKEKFIDEIEKQIERLQQTPERFQTSVERASWAIWERGYSYPGISYYNKGKILGLLLDLEIRHITKNRFSLDDVLRFMNWWFAKENVGFKPGDIRRTLSAISQWDFSEFFDKYVSGTVELPYEKVFAFAGLNVYIETEWVPNIGEFLFVGPRNRVVTVQANSPVEEAGLKRHDYILAVDGEEVSSPRQIQEIVNTKKIGSDLILKVLRDDVELELTAKVGRKEKVDVEIEPMRQPSELQLKIQQGWLEGWTGNEYKN